MRSRREGVYRIPFNRPGIVGTELRYIAEAMERGHLSGDGGFTRKCHDVLDQYTWVDLGSSYLPAEILAAFLYAQLEAREEIQNKRRRIWEFYYAHLEGLAERHGFRLPIVPEGCEQPYHMFYVLLPSTEQRQLVISGLRARGIMAVFHYLPLHLSEMGARSGAKAGDCPVTEDVSPRLLRLPFFNELTEADQGSVVAAIAECLETRD
jgi:dTDP-4-amino-4,6-dideoxygalactose transaminase